MATDKKHIAVYLDPAVEQALLAFCQEKGLISKKGTMYSAGVNAALAAFFGVANTGNIPQTGSNILSPVSTIPDFNTGNIPQSSGNIPAVVAGNIPTESIDTGALPGKLRA